jgi:hypothetical protein
MNFKQFFTEQHNPWQVVRRGTEEDLLPLKEKGLLKKVKVIDSWVCQFRNPDDIYLVIHVDKLHYNLSIYKNGNYTGHEVYEQSELGKAIKQWELLHGLKGSAKDTWEDILF